MIRSVAKSPIVVLALLALLTPVASHARADEQEQQRTISVVGFGEINVSPDLAVFSLAVETAEAEADAAISANAERTSAVVKAVEAALPEAGKVSTSGYSLEPRYAEPRPGSRAAPEITGYVARNQVRVETPDLDGVGSLLDAGLGAGANRVDQLSFTLADRRPQLRAALEAAGQEAKAQAESIARSLGVTLGKVLSASTQTQPRPLAAAPYARSMAMAEASYETPIQPGDVTVSATLYVTYAIE